MRLVAADEYGVLRAVAKPPTQSWESAAAETKQGTSDKARSVTSLCSADTQPAAFLLVSRADGSVTCHEPATLDEVSHLSGQGTGKAVYSGVVHGSGDAAVAVVSENGCIRQYQVTQGSKGCLEQSGITFETGKDLTCCQFSCEKPLASVGSNGKEVTIWDLQTGTKVHALKGTRGDPQTRLQDKPWTTCIHWLPNARLVCGTAQHKVRLYDVEAQKRPLVEVAWLDACVTAVCPSLQQGVTWVANAKGFIQAFDMRTHTMAAAVKGQIAGSVRSLQVQDNLLASVSIDKWLRVHDARTRQMLCKVYLKQPLTACVWDPHKSCTSDVEQ